MWVVLPLKDFVLAKQRLSGLLSAAERRALFQAMVEDVLGELSGSAFAQRIVLVSDDPAAHLLAEHFEVDFQSESELGVRGLNPVVQAMAQRAAAAEADSLMVVHADLPGLRRTDLQRLVNYFQNADGPEVLVATDRAGQGSNVVLCRPPNALRFQYGPGSARKHLDAAWQAGLSARTVNWPGLATDVDTVQDLGCLLNSQSLAEKTRQYLRATGIERRLAVALGAAAPGETDDHVA